MPALSVCLSYSGLRDVVEISSAVSHALALTSDGNVLSWGIGTHIVEPVAMVDPTVNCWHVAFVGHKWSQHRSNLSRYCGCLFSLASLGLRGQLGRSVTADLKEEPTEDGGKPPYDLDLVFEQHLTPVSGSHRRVVGGGEGGEEGEAVAAAARRAAWAPAMPRHTTQALL